MSGEIERAQRDAMSIVAAQKMAEATAQLLDEMDGRQRTAAMVQKMQDLLIAVNRASPGHVELLCTRLQEMEWPPESSWVQV